MTDENSDSTSNGDNDPVVDAAANGGTRNGSKRRASRAGTRSVATLSEAQLARKRANDREAQRLIRQRTKDHIEQLESRIQELSSGQEDEAELLELRRRNAELEKELKDLKEIRALSEANTASTELASRTGKAKVIQVNLSAPTPFPSYISAAGRVSGSSSPLSTPDNSWQAHTSPHMSAVSSYSSTPDLNQNRGSFSPGYFHCDHISGNYASENFQYDHTDLDTLGVMGASTTSHISDVESDRTWRLAGPSRPDRLISGMQTSMPVHSPSAIPRSFPSQPSVPSWEMPLRHTVPTDPIDVILLGIVQEQRKMAQSGATGTLVTGPHNPTMNMIIYPDQAVASHPVLKILSALLTKLRLSALPERAAGLYLAYNFVQWQIHLSKATFDRLYDWQIPRASQLLTPYPIWASLIIWGELRDAVIGNQEKYGTDEFLHLYTTNLNVNWPWRESDAFRFDEGGEVKISEEFERHISSSSVWSLDAPFARRYPELESFYRVTVPEHDRSVSASQNGPSG